MKTLTASAHLDLVAFVRALDREQRLQMADLIEANLNAPQVKTGSVLIIREPGRDGQVTDLGFVHHEFETDIARVSEAGRIRINIRPAKSQSAQATSTATMRPTVVRRETTERLDEAGLRESLPY